MTPALSVERITWGGKPAVLLVVDNAGMNADLRDLLDRLGVLPVADIANRRALRCMTPAELDAARAPLACLFDRAGAWIGR